MWAEYIIINKLIKLILLSLKVHPLGETTPLMHAAICNNLRHLEIEILYELLVYRIAGIFRRSLISFFSFSILFERIYSERKFNVGVTASSGHVV